MITSIDNEWINDISFVNELALIFDRSGIDTNEVLDAASTKWNFLPFKPGLVGGHCLPVDPYYLSYIAKKNKFDSIVTLSGRKTNNIMEKFIPFKRLRKVSPNPKVYLRLHRGEFGHNFDNKKINKNIYIKIFNNNYFENFNKII